MNIIKHIPNAITCLNVIAGSVAVLLAFRTDFNGALLAIFIAAVFDFADGLAARLLHAYSEMGKELDSLADMVSFGLAPAALAFSLLAKMNAPIGISYLGFIITAFSALRLAKFNIDTRQTTSFIGLPTPANAIFWAGLCAAYGEVLVANNLWIVVLAMVLTFSYLLVSEIPMFSLKLKNLAWKDNSLRFVFLIVCVLLLILLWLKALPIIIAWYILLSGIEVLRKGM